MPIETVPTIYPTLRAGWLAPMCTGLAPYVLDTPAHPVGKISREVEIGGSLIRFSISGASCATCPRDASRPARSGCSPPLAASAASWLDVFFVDFRRDLTRAFH